MDGVADALRVVEEMAADEGLFGGRGVGRGGARCGEGGHGFLLLLTVGRRGAGRYDFGHRGRELIFWLRGTSWRMSRMLGI